MKGTKRFILLLAGAALLISGREKKRKHRKRLRRPFSVKTAPAGSKGRRCLSGLIRRRRLRK